MTDRSDLEIDFTFSKLSTMQEMNPIIHCICASMHTDKIFLLGTYPAFPETFGLEYDLLVLVDSGYKKPMHEFESLISNRCHDLAMVTASVYKTDVVNQLLKQGNIFFSTMCDADKLIFDRGQPILTKHCSGDAAVYSKDLESEFQCLFSKAKNFFAGAISYRTIGDNQLSAFMLHQTVEQGLNSFLVPLIKYRLQTHNLNKLFLYARRFSRKFGTVFPKNTDAEIQLYQTLHKAYIYGRYKNNFLIGNAPLQLLIERITELLEIIRLIFYEKTDELRNRKSELA